MDGFEKRKQKKIKQIFSASLDLVSQYGFDKVSVNEIAQKARVSPATIYNYFETKEQLYLHMLNHWIDTKLEEYKKTLQSDHSYTEKIKEIMTLEASNLSFLAHLSQGNASQSVHFFLSSIEEKLEAFFQHLVYLGKREGYISPNLSDKILQKYFRLFFQEINGLLINHANTENDDEIEQLLQLFFYGLSPHQAPNEHK